MTDPATRIADVLRRRGLAAPARLLVDAHRPLAPLLTDLGAAVGPLLGSTFGAVAGDVRTLLDDEHGLDRLVERLDADDRAGEADAEPG
jgi:hypothetical protein